MVEWHVQIYLQKLFCVMLTDVLSWYKHVVAYSEWQLYLICFFIPLPAIDTYFLNPLSPHDALEHHFTSLKTNLIFLQLGVLEQKFPWNWFTNE